MGDIKKYALMGGVVLLTIIVYRSFLKPVFPASLQNAIGL